MCFHVIKINIHVGIIFLLLCFSFNIIYIVTTDQREPIYYNSVGPEIGRPMFKSQISEIASLGLSFSETFLAGLFLI